MTEKLQKITKEEIEKLPKETQDAINLFDWVKLSEEIGKKYLLSEIEINNFQLEILLILLGLEDPGLFALNIENEVGTSKDEAKKITEEVFQKIFTPINNTLIKNLKKGDTVKNSNHKQNLNFILSGGDYSAFVEQKNVDEVRDGGAIVPVFSIKKENLKRKFDI